METSHRRARLIRRSVCGPDTGPVRPGSIRSHRRLCSLPYRAGFDAAVSALVLNFVPDAGAALTGMTRAVTAGGLVAAYVWDDAGRMEVMR